MIDFDGVYPPVLTPYRGDEVAVDRLGQDLDRLDAVLAFTPAYFSLTMKPPAPIRRYGAVADRSPVPVLLSSFPANTGINLEADAGVRRAEHPNIRGITGASSW